MPKVAAISVDCTFIRASKHTIPPWGATLPHSIDYARSLDQVLALVCGASSLLMISRSHTTLQWSEQGITAAAFHNHRTIFSLAPHIHKDLLSVQMNVFQVLWSHRTPILWRKNGRLYDIAMSKEGAWEI